MREALQQGWATPYTEGEDVAPVEVALALKPMVQSLRGLLRLIM